MTSRARLRVLLGVALALALAGVLLLRPGPAAAPRRTGVAADEGSAPPVEPPPARAAALPVPAASGPAPAAPPAVEPFAVEGRVVSAETGRGVAGADVTFSRAGAAASARTGADGSFRVVPPVEGRWLLAAVTAAGFLPFAPEWGCSPVTVEARAGRPVRGVELVLAPARPIAGTVVGPDGAPVPGAEVRLLGVRSEATLVALEDRFTADAAGAFRFAAPRGTIVEARKAGFAPGRAAVGARATVDGRLVVRLRAAKKDAPAPSPSRIAGRVVERGTGAPIAGALVVAEREVPRGGLPAGQAVSGDDGRFVLGELADGTYRLTATAEGHAPGAAAVAGGAADAVVALDPGSRLRGCVRDADGGEPVTRFTVTVGERRPGRPGVAERSRAFLDGSGCWLLDDLAAGPVTVSVAAPGFAPSEDVAAEVPASGEAAVDVRLSRGRRFRGVVLDAVTRAPIPGALVELQWTAPEVGGIVGAAEEAWTGADGGFELSGLSRRFSLEVTAPDHDVRVAGGLEVPPEADPAPVVIALTPVAPGEEPHREITGIGVAIAPRDGTLVVTGVVPGSGAAAAGIVTGDAIVRVDGVPVPELGGFEGAANAIRGPEGSSVRLAIRRADGTLDLWVGRGLVRG